VEKNSTSPHNNLKETHFIFAQFPNYFMKHFTKVSKLNGISTSKHLPAMQFSGTKCEMLASGFVAIR
jgi:hypothetical protein